MWTSIVAFFKALAELLSFSKWIYNETKKTQGQKEGEIDVRISQEKEEAKEQGRPSWD